MLDLPYHTALEGIMGGRTSTTWTSGSAWRHKEMKTIRVPVALEHQVLEYAKALDRGENPVQQKLEEFLKIKRRQYHRRIAHDSEMTGGVRWFVFNEFCYWISKI